MSKAKDVATEYAKAENENSVDVLIRRFKAGDPEVMYEKIQVSPDHRAKSLQFHLHFFRVDPRLKALGSSPVFISFHCKLFTNIISQQLFWQSSAELAVDSLDGDPRIAKYSISHLPSPHWSVEERLKPLNPFYQDKTKVRIEYKGCASLCWLWFRIWKKS